MKRILLFLARLAIATLLLLPVMPFFYRAYGAVLAMITGGGFSMTTSSPGVPYDGSSTLYTLMVLILATPKLTVTRRILGISGGIVLSLLIDAAMNLIWGDYPYVGSPDPTALHVYVTRAWEIAGHGFMSILLWFIVAQRQIEILFKGESVQTDV
jgi:hypothetical protein